MKKELYATMQAIRDVRQSDGSFAKEAIIYSVEIDFSELHAMARQAVRNKMQRCKAGPLTVHVNERRPVVVNVLVPGRIAELEAIIATSEISEVNGAEPQYDDNGNVKVDMATCGTCGKTWNDALLSSRTPAPSARCPYEDIHPEIAELAQLKRR